MPHLFYRLDLQPYTWTRFSRVPGPIFSVLLACLGRNIHGAKGIDTCAREYALSHGLKLTEFLPDYRRYGRAAPLVRNREIVAYADQVLAFWDGKSPGTKYVIDQFKKQKKTVTVHLL